MSTLSTRFEMLCNDPERKANRSISWFKEHLKYASTVTLKNHTGSQEFLVLATGDRGFTIEVNEKPQYIQYPRAGYMKLANPGKLQFLTGFNGEVIMECMITQYADGSSAPEFIDYPPEEDEYGRKKKRAKAAA